MSNEQAVSIRLLRLEDDEDGAVLKCICDGNMEAEHVKFFWSNRKTRESMISSEYGWYRSGLEKSKSTTLPQYKSFVMLLDDKEIIGHVQLHTIDNTKSDKISSKHPALSSLLKWLIDFILTFPYLLIFRIGLFSAFRAHYILSKTLHGRFLDLIQDYLPKSFEINAFVISNKYNGKGYGRKLFNHLLNEIYSKYESTDLCNAPPIIINTFTSSAGFWQKMKFVLVGQRECVYFGDCFVDFCMIHHPKEAKLKELQDACKNVWNENKRSNVHLDFVFPSFTQKKFVFVMLLSIAYLFVAVFVL